MLAKIALTIMIRNNALFDRTLQRAGTEFGIKTGLDEVIDTGGRLPIQCEWPRRPRRNF